MSKEKTKIVHKKGASKLISQLQAERDSLKEQLEAIEMADRIIIKDLHDKLESSERENKELKAEVNFLESKYDTLQNTDRQIIEGLKSQLSSLKEQADKLEGALKLAHKWHDTEMNFPLTEITEALSSYKQTKG